MKSTYYRIQRSAAVVGLCLLAAVLTSVPALAQAEFGRVEEMKTNAGTYYYYVRPATPTIQVQVMGAVRSPGLYEVSDGTSVNQLLALTGGPSTGTRTNRQVIETILRVYRPSQKGPDPLFEERLSYAVSHPSTYPVLEHGDIITMEVIERERFSWRDFSRVISSVGILTLAIERLSRTF